MSPALEGGFFTTGPPGKSLSGSILNTLSTYLDSLLVLILSDGKPPWNSIKHSCMKSPSRNYSKGVEWMLHLIPWAGSASKRTDYIFIYGFSDSSLEYLSSLLLAGYLMLKDV